MLEFLLSLIVMSLLIGLAWPVMQFVFQNAWGIIIFVIIACVVLWIIYSVFKAIPASELARQKESQDTRRKAQLARADAMRKKQDARNKISAERRAKYYRGNQLFNKGANMLEFLLSWLSIIIPGIIAVLCYWYLFMIIRGNCFEYEVCSDIIPICVIMVFPTVLSTISFVSNSHKKISKTISRKKKTSK